MLPNHSQLIQNGALTLAPMNSAINTPAVTSMRTVEPDNPNREPPRLPGPVAFDELVEGLLLNRLNTYPPGWIGRRDRLCARSHGRGTCRTSWYDLLSIWRR